MFLSRAQARMSSLSQLSSGGTTVTLRYLPAAALALVAALLLTSPHAFAQDATPTKAIPPTQPATGPGGGDYDFDSVVFSEHGEAAGGFLLFEPADPRGGGTPAIAAPLPIVLFLSACCETE